MRKILFWVLWAFCLSFGIFCTMTAESADDPLTYNILNDNPTAVWATWQLEGNTKPIMSAHSALSSTTFDLYDVERYSDNYKISGGTWVDATGDTITVKYWYCQNTISRALKSYTATDPILNFNVSGGRATVHLNGSNSYLLGNPAAPNAAWNLDSVLNNNLGVQFVYLRINADTGSGANSYSIPIICRDNTGYMGLVKGTIGANNNVWAWNWDGNEDRTGTTYSTSAFGSWVWYHTGGSLSLYKDGSSISSVSSGNTSSMSNYACFGGNGTAGLYADTDYVVVAMWDSDLTQNQITNTHNFASDQGYETPTASPTNTVSPTFTFTLTSTPSVTATPTSSATPTVTPIPATPVVTKVNPVLLNPSGLYDTRRLTNNSTLNILQVTSALNADTREIWDIQNGTYNYKTSSATNWISAIGDTLTVTKFYDQSGFNRTFNTYFTITVDFNKINGRAALFFSGVNSTFRHSGNFCSEFISNTAGTFAYYANMTITAETRSTIGNCPYWIGDGEEGNGLQRGNVGGSGDMTWAYSASDGGVSVGMPTILNQWHSSTWHYNGTSLKIGQNGNFYNTATLSQPWALDSKKFQAGDPSGGLFYFIGWLTTLIFYPTALTAEEHLSQYYYMEDVTEIPTLTYTMTPTLTPTPTQTPVLNVLYRDDFDSTEPPDNYTLFKNVGSGSPSFVSDEVWQGNLNITRGTTTSYGWYKYDLGHSWTQPYTISFDYISNTLTGNATVSKFTVGFGCNTGGTNYYSVQHKVSGPDTFIPTLTGVGGGVWEVILNSPTALANNDHIIIENLATYQNVYQNGTLVYSQHLTSGTPFTGTIFFGISCGGTTGQTNACSIANVLVTAPVSATISKRQKLRDSGTVPGFLKKIHGWFLEVD